MIKQMQDEKLSIETILDNHYSRTFKVRDYNNLHILVDTCSIKRIPTTNRKPLFTHKRQDGGEYNLLLTRRVVEEMNRNSNVDFCLVNFIYSIISDMIDPEVSNENFELIYKVNDESTKLKKREHDHIGIADIQMLSYAIDRARQGLQTIIISDDNHILGTMSYLRKKSAEKEIFRENMFAFGLQREIEDYKTEDYKVYSGGENWSKRI